MNLLPYAILALLPAVFSRMTRYRPSLVCISLTCICFVLFMGFRDEVGPDWSGYLKLHAIAFSQSWNEIVTGQEPLSMALFRLSDLAGTGMIISNCVASAILIIGVMAFSRRTPLFWVAFSACVPYLVLVFGMSGIRQGMSVGVTLYVLSRWTKWGTVRKSLGITVAVLFHSSAIVMAVAVVFGLQIAWRFRLMLAIPLLAAVVFVVSSSTHSDLIVTKYTTRHLGEGQVVSSGAFFHIALVAGPAIFGLVNRQRLLPYILYKDLFYLGCIASIALIPLSLISTTGASRLSLYLYFVPMLIYPAAVVSYFKGNVRNGQTIICVSQAMLLVLWLLTANTALPYMPYRNFLF